MTFEEFKKNLDMIREYHRKLAKYGAGWMREFLGPAFPRTYIPATKKYNDKHRYNRHARELQKPSGYPEEFESQISDILQDIIFDKTEEDWKEDHVTVSESGQVIYSAESDSLLGKGQIFGDRERTTVIFSNGEPQRVKVMTFEILNYLYFGGLQPETIARTFDVTRKTIYNQRDKGLCELYKIYTERSQDNEKHS